MSGKTIVLRRREVEAANDAESTDAAGEESGFGSEKLRAAVIDEVERRALQDLRLVIRYLKSAGAGDRYLGRELESVVWGIDQINP